MEGGEARETGQTSGLIWPLAACQAHLLSSPHVPPQTRVIRLSRLAQAAMDGDELEGDVEGVGRSARVAAHRDRGEAHADRAAATLRVATACRSSPWCG